jgi:hypothetical protein
MCGPQSSAVSHTQTPKQLTGTMGKYQGQWCSCIVTGQVRRLKDDVVSVVDASFTINLGASLPLRSMTGKSADEAIKGLK